MEWVRVIQTKTREGSTLWRMTHAALIFKKIQGPTRFFNCGLHWKFDFFESKHSWSSAKELYVVILISFALDPA